MSDTKVYRLTVHPEKILAPYGMCMPFPQIQVLRPGETEYRTWGETIEGFEAQDGVEYVIEIEDYPRPPPLPMDCSSRLYRLIKIISQKKV